MTLSRLVVLVIALAFAVTLSANAENSIDRAEASDSVIKLTADQHLAAPPRQFPKLELSAGYSYANINLGPQSSLFAPANHSYNGMQLNAKFNLRSHLGLLFDLAGEAGHSTIPDSLGYETHLQLEETQFLAGPEFTLRAAKFNAFAHTLFGLTRTGLTQQVGSYAEQKTDVAHRTNLAFGVGAGIERNWKRHFAFRLLQADYIPTRLDGKWESHFRLGTGLIVKF